MNVMDDGGLVVCVNNGLPSDEWGGCAASGAVSVVDDGGF